MKTRLTTLTWRGSASVDPRFSAAMLPWSISDIRNQENYLTLSIGIDNGYLEAYNTDFELQFVHQLKYILGYCRIIVKQEKGKKNSDFLIPKSNSTRVLPITIGNDNVAEISGPDYGLIYLLKNPQDPLLHIHLYECKKFEQMAELMQQMREPASFGSTSVGSIPQSIVAGSGNSNDIHKALRGQEIHSTPASNLKLSEQMRNAHHDNSPTLSHSQNGANNYGQIYSSQGRLSTSKSFSSGLNHSSSGGNIQNSASVSSSLSSLPDISANNSQFFEVLYVGKIKVSHKRVPFTFIDDALPKFKAYDAQKLKQQLETTRKITSDEKAETEGDSSFTRAPISVTASAQVLKNINEYGEFASNDERPDSSIISENKENAVPQTSDEGEIFRGRRVSHFDIPTKKIVPIRRDRSASIGSIPIVEQNRTMVFLIGQSDLRLISPDRKQVLLHKEFRDVASCAQGQKNADHFGIICRDVNNDGYIGYVFKCQSENVADEIIIAISQAFLVCSEQKQKSKASAQIYSCEHCPMLWYHKLCTDIEGLSDKKTQYMLFKRIDTTLTEEEQRMLMEKYHGAEEAAGHSIGEQNQFLMMLLRAHCESKQQRHVHDTAENRTEFLNQYLGGTGIFMKAKRSLTSSFDHLLKRRTSKDDFSGGLSSIKDFNSCGDLKGDFEPQSRTRASTVGSSPSSSRKNSDLAVQQVVPQLKSPMMDIFIKVGNSPRDNSSHAGSWRQAMLHRVVTPSEKIKTSGDEYMSPLRTSRLQARKRNRIELRELWQVAIKQTIILNRMEKENAHLQAKQNAIKSNEIKRIKLEYDEITTCERCAIEMWENLLDVTPTKTIPVRHDPKKLYQAIRNGVPRTRRGEIWKFLAQQHTCNTEPVDNDSFANFNTPYHMLLKNLTEHQHAIFIDLGRTFPDHKFYKDALGIGQLSLFNLLKAYSILDPELGYCQGLGFICAVLLLHLEEADAFELLKHLMFKRQMREKYLPDMKQFQLQLYQLSRLLKDNIPELYDWFDQHEISPTLYAAPWILTVFSSHFPLGFVARVFDLLFLESFDVIFRCAISLLDVHKEQLLQQDNFEDIMNYLKTVVPKISPEIMDKVFRNVFKCDFSRQLIEYQVEYNVLKEEISSQNHHLENLKRVKDENQQLESQVQFAQSSLAQLDRTRQTQQNQIQTLQMQVQTLENTVQTLVKYIEHTLETKSDDVLPNEICRIIQQVQDLQHQQVLQQKKRSPIFLDRKIGKSISFNSNLGHALNVLEEGNEQDIVVGTPTKKKPFFQSSFEQIRLQKAGLRLNKLDECLSPEHVNDRNTARINTNDDSGIATPISPQLHAPSTTPMIPDSRPLVPAADIHPLSGDVNVQFNGTTQLKSIKPRIQSRQNSISSIVGNIGDKGISTTDQNNRS
ncbi:TBC1 domain family member 1 isoform X2 [Wyeomyia smithii]|uniref:TBC1 domain family member 1 isoform X2 n=1 Tax=Wyeomyia smithii TaxID=174621 RepID=UPI00246807F3|nr:TBC1 domain family member 1 isoform X2 [Wyeomyia smithii]